LVRDVVVIDQQSLAAEIIGKLFNWMEVLKSIYRLSGLQVELHALLRLMFLQSSNQLIYDFEDFDLVNFNKLHSILVGFCLLVKTQTTLKVSRELEE